MMGEELKYFIKDSLEAGDIKVCKMQKHKKCREIGRICSSLIHMDIAIRIVIFRYRCRYKVGKRRK